MFKKEIPIIFVGLSVVVAALVLSYTVFVKQEMAVPVGPLVVSDDNQNGESDEVITDFPDIEDDVIDDNISDWKTYQNEEFGYEIKYPEDYSVEDISKRAIGDDPTKYPWYSRTGFALSFVVFKDPISIGGIAFNLEVLNTTDKDKIKSTGGWNLIEESGVKKMGDLNIYLYSIDSGTNNMQVIFHNGKAYSFLHYLSEKDFDELLSTFRFTE